MMTHFHCLPGLKNAILESKDGLLGLSWVIFPLLCFKFHRGSFCDGNSEKIKKKPCFLTLQPFSYNGHMFSEHTAKHFRLLKLLFDAHDWLVYGGRTNITKAGKEVHIWHVSTVTHNVVMLTIVTGRTC